MAIVLSHPRFCLRKYANFRRTLLPQQVLISISKSKPSIRGCKTTEALRSGSGEQSQDLKRHVDYLHEHFSRFCDDDPGVDVSMFDDHFVFSDPVTKHDTIDGYLFNLQLVNALLHPKVQIHSVRQTRPYEITIKWTAVMTYAPLPWKPELVFTGTSIMGVNPKTQKFCSHVDLWDSIEKNDYFSLEGFFDFIKQLQVYETPDLEMPKYQVLRRTATYEVRNYDSFSVADTKGDALSGFAGFDDVAGYIFEKNPRMERIPLINPVLTEAHDNELSEASIRIVLPLTKEAGSFPARNAEVIRLRKVDGGIAAAIKFSGKPTRELVCNKEKELHSALLKDGLKPREGCLLAFYNDPGRTWSFTMRNEVLIWLDDYTL